MARLQRSSGDAHAMLNLRFPGISVDGIEEISGHRYRPDFLLPAVTRDIVARHQGWMSPDLYDPQRDLLAMIRQSNLVRIGGRNVLIDTCVGDCKSRTVPAFHRLQSPWADNFRRSGLRFDDIDLVVCTHLHVDHVGWNTRFEDGRWVPTFPNARYVFGRTEFTHWQREYAAGRDSPDGPVFADSVAPVVDSGLAWIVDDDADLFEGLRLEPTPGHSVGHVAIHLEREGTHLVFSGDVMHHPIQVREPDLSSRFCEDPQASRLARRRFLETHSDSDTIIIPAHFERGTAGRIVSASDGFHFDFLNGPSTRQP